MTTNSAVNTPMSTRRLSMIAWRLAVAVLLAFALCAAAFVVGRATATSHPASTTITTPQTQPHISSSLLRSDDNCRPHQPC